MALGAAKKLVTVAELDGFSEEGLELLGGLVVREAMTGFEHGDAQSSIATFTKGSFRGAGPPGGDGGWWLASEVDVVYDELNLFRHDLSGWRKSRIPERPRGRMRLPPDWVCEILSTNRQNDLVHKRRVLHRCQVPHYWTVDPEARVLEVQRWSADGYVVIASVSPGESARLEPFQAVEVAVADLFGDEEVTQPGPG